MRICFFAHAASIHTVRWCEHFASLGHEIHLISFSEGVIPNVKVHFVSTGRIKVEGGNWKVLLKFRAIKKLLKQIQPDIFHAHYATSYGISGALCGFHPYVITGLGTDILISPKQSKIVRILLRFALKRADAITVMAQHMVEPVTDLGISKAKIYEIPFGIDPELFNAKEKQLSTDKFVVLSTRNLEPVYNIPHLIKAVAKVKKDIPNIQLNVIGMGTLEEELRRLTQELGIAENVLFLGKVPQKEIVREMNHAHVFVSVSLSDGNNISLNEAMACETFSIATDIPANHQWIRNGENGFLVEIDDVEGLANRLLETYTNFDRLNKKAIEINHSLLEEKGIWSKNMHKMETIYTKLLNKS